MFGFNKPLLGSGLLLSSLHDQDDFYDVFIRDLKKAKQEVIIESPFISYKRLNYLLTTLSKLIRHDVRVVINTKHPDEQNNSFSRAGEYIALLQDAGIKVLFTGGHHRKLAIIDKHILYEGSLNILSQNDSCEVMRRISSRQLTGQMLDFLNLDRFYGVELLRNNNER